MDHKSKNPDALGAMLKILGGIGISAMVDGEVTQDTIIIQRCQLLLHKPEFKADLIKLILEHSPKPVTNGKQQ